MNLSQKETGRHLAAILFTDIVGYTSLMQRDESLALATVRRHHEVLEKHIVAHDGQLYQYYGDGSLTIFTSATQAVRCAYEIQKELQQEPVVPLRIGIHIGEIYSEGGKIFGDGVNIASRIESIGQAGTVLFSRDVYEKVRNHTLFQIRSIGIFEFKNVEDPVEVFALTNPEIKTPDLKLIEGKLKEIPKKKKWQATYWMGLALLILVTGYFVALRPKYDALLPPEEAMPKSIAVLPFKNLNEVQTEDYLSIGLAEDILTQLAQIADLKVISRSSSMRYKHSDKSIRAIAKELGVASILEGSIRRYDNNLRVSVQLIHGHNESVIWADDFDRQFEDVLNVQRDIALAVSEKLKVALTPAIKNRFENKTYVQPEAYIEYQKGQDQLLRTSGTKTDILNAIANFEKSIALDSTFARAWIGLADAYTEGVFWHRIEATQAIQQARLAVNIALALDPESGEGYGVLGSIDYLERHFPESEKNLLKAIELSPNYSLTYDRLGWVKLIKGEVEEMMRLFAAAVELDPLATRYQGSFGNALTMVGQNDRGIEIISTYLNNFPQDNYLLWTMGFLHARKGEPEKAIAYLNKRTIGTKTNWVLGYAYAKSGQQDKAEEILKNNLEKKKTDIVPDYMIAVQLCALGREREALDYLSKGVENLGESFFLLNLETDPFFQSLHPYPEFKVILKKAKRAMSFDPNGSQ